MASTTTIAAGREHALGDLDARFSGEILRPGDRGYAAARRLWNGSIDRHPAAILRPRTAGDVATAVLHARKAGLEIAVRGGGHSTAGHSMSDGGVTQARQVLGRVVDALRANGFAEPQLVSRSAALVGCVAHLA